MSEGRFSLLLNLVELDQKIAAKEEERNQGVSTLADLKQSIKSLLDREETLKKQLHDARYRVDRFELDMKALDEQEASKKMQFDLVRSLKEYNSVKAELDSIHLEQENKERELLAAWNNLENAQRELKEYQGSLPEKRLDYERKMSALIQELDSTTQQIEAIVTKRPDLQKDVPPEWLEKYTMMRARVSNPVVTLTDTTCSACFNDITAQDVLSIRRGALIQCKGCYRLLYMQKL